MSDASLQELHFPRKCQNIRQRSLLVELLYVLDSQLDSHLTSNPWKDTSKISYTNVSINSTETLPVSRLALHSKTAFFITYHCT